MGEKEVRIYADDMQLFSQWQQLLYALGCINGAGKVGHHFVGVELKTLCQLARDSATSQVPWGCRRVAAPPNR